MSDQPKADPQPAGDLPAATGNDGPSQNLQNPELAAREADAPISDMQRTTLEALCREAGVPFDATMTTTDAARRISELQRAKDRNAEAARVARGAPTEAVPSDAGEEDPGAALDAPGTKQAIEGEADAIPSSKPAARQP